MSVKYSVTENFKSTEKDRKTSFLNKLAAIILLAGQRSGQPPPR